MSNQSSGSFCRVQFAVNEGRYQEAISLLDSVLALIPERSDVRLYRARLYVLAGRPELAIEEMQTLLLDPDCYTEAHFHLSGIYALLGDYEQSVYHLRMTGRYVCRQPSEMFLSQSAYKN